jgi:DNA-binding response OmpR family regulator
MLLVAGYSVLSADQSIEASGSFFPGMYSAVLIGCLGDAPLALNMCSVIRRAAPNTPLFVIGPEAQAGDKVRFLEKGADDYLTTPVYTDEMLAKLNRVMSTYELSSTGATGSGLSV